MTPLVSVIIPSYNRKEQIKAAAASVFAQTFRNWELIVVDDGSDDGTDLSCFGPESERRCELIRLELNGGVSAARNTGVRASKGEWLAFLDSDDVWHPQKLEKQIAWIKENPDFRILQTREIWVRNGVRVNPPASHVKRSGYIFRESLDRCMITPSSVMMAGSLFCEAGGFNESLPACEDYDLWLRITCRYPVGLIEQDLLTRYGGHSDQLSSQVFALDRFRVRALMDLLSCDTLSMEQREAVKNKLVEKAEILAKGFFKHGKPETGERYKSIAKHYGVN
jgi:glycosyltransferase involved in cell wall biosynthesis